MIAATELSVRRFIEERQPRFLIAPRVENFILDITERVLGQHGIPYIGLWRSAFLKDHFFFTNRGTPKKVKIPDQKAVSVFIDSVSKIDFKATSLRSEQFTKIQFRYYYFKYLCRDSLLEISRLLTGNNYNFRELATRYHCDEYKADFMLRKDLFLEKDRLTNWLGSCTKKKLFIALQVNPEATIDYYANDPAFIDVGHVVNRIVSICRAAGIAVVIKDHPNMFGRRNYAWIYQLLDNDVVLADYGVDSNLIIDGVDFVFTWSGTVSVQAYIKGKVPIVVCAPYAGSHPGFIKIDKMSDLDELPSILSDTSKIPYPQIYELAFSILSTHLPGSVYAHDSISVEVKSFCRSLEWCFDKGYFDPK